MRGWRRKRDILILLLFMAGLWLPVLGNLFMSPVDNTEEKRNLEEMPELGWQRSIIRKFPEKFESYFNDHFGFRGQLISWYNKLHLALNVSPSDKVFLGKQGWLFYRDSFTASDVMHVGTKDLAVFAKWRASLKAKQELLAVNNTKYLLVIAPDKHTIYPEYFPVGYSRVEDKSRLDRFLEYMHDNSDVNVLDLRPALLEEKKVNRIYHVTDTHWNQRGAVIASNAIIKALSGKFNMETLRKPRAISFSEVDRKGGDLSSLLGLSDEMRERVPVPQPPDSHCVKKTFAGFMELKLQEHEIPYAFRCADAEHKLLMFHDSFGNGLIQHLIGHFKESLFLRIRPTQDVLGALLNKYKPDVVIELKVERSLHALPEENDDAAVRLSWKRASDLVLKLVEQEPWVGLSGTIKTAGDTDICAMVLASGKYTFSCYPVGRFSLTDLPREKDGSVKRHIFAHGFFPKVDALTGSSDDAVVMIRSGTCPSYNIPYEPAFVPGSAGKEIYISGQVLLQNSETPICAMVLANGQYMFSCDGTGSYALKIPLDAKGQFKLQVYANGFAPMIQVFDDFQTTNDVRMARAVECQ